MSSLSDRPLERYGYAPPAGRRVVALIGTAAIYALVLCGFFLTIRHSVSPTKLAAPTVVELLPLASPPEKETEEKPAPVEKHEKPIAKRTPHEAVAAKVLPLPNVVPVPPVPAAAPAVSEPGPKQPETVAPPVVRAPPAPQVSSNAPDTWEGRLLAALEKSKRYPAISRGRREQGVVYVRFRMNREGQVLSASIARGSGYAALDHEALATIRRAEPLPKIPADKPDEVELSVPIEFFMR